MTKKKDIFSLLKADHRKVEGIFAKLEKTTQRAVGRREKLYGELRMELSAHAEAEEKAVYPILKQEEKTEDIAFESVEEHSIVKFLFSKLDDTPCDSQEWTAQITALKEVVEHHVEEEESDMFKKMRAAFAKEDLEMMAVGFSRAKAAILRSGKPDQLKAAA